MAHTVVTKMFTIGKQREMDVGAQLGFLGLCSLRPGPHPYPGWVFHSKSSSVVKIAHDDSPPLWLVWPLIAVPFVLGWRNQPFLKLYCCLQVHGGAGGLLMPTHKSVPCFSQISVGWRVPGFNMSLPGKTAFTILEEVVTDANHSQIWIYFRMF